VAAITNYKTEKKEEIRVLDQAGNVVTMYRIYATSEKGTYFHIDVPDKELKNAPKLLTARATELDAI